MNKVVKCKNVKCELYFMHTEKSTKCPFCKMEYGEVVEKPEEKSKEREVPVKTQKESFKI